MAEYKRMTPADFELGGRYPVGSEQWAARVRRRANTLNTALDSGYMELAAILYMVYDTPINGDPNNAPIYREWGFDTWEDWAFRELNLKPAKAQYLRRIHYVLNVELADMAAEVRTRICSLGISKARHLLRVLTPSNASRWCEIAETSSAYELGNAVKASLIEAETRALDAATEGDDSDVDPVPTRGETIHSVSFKLYPDQKDVVRQAIDRAGELASSGKAGHGLTLICLDFLANNDFRMAQDGQMQRKFVAKLEGLLGKKLVMIDPETREIEYGGNALRALVDTDENSEPTHVQSSLVPANGIA